MGNRRPPRLAAFLVQLRHSRAAAEVLLGDLAEEFAGNGRSAHWYWRQTWSLLWLQPPQEFQNIERNTEMSLLSGYWNDVRYAVRSLAKSPGPTAMAMMAIALGVGVNTAIFTLLNAVALRPLPVPSAGQVMAIYQTFRGDVRRNVNGSISLFSYSEYQNYRDHNHAFSGLAAYYPMLQATLAGERPEALAGQLTSCNYFDVLGVHPVLGRGFTESECSAGGAPVVVLSDSLWRNKFGADNSILGKSITLNRVPLTVIGVAPPELRGTEALVSSFWVPITLDPAIHPGGALKSDNLSWLAMIGRLKPGISTTECEADLSVIAGRIDQAHPGRKTTLSINVANYMGEPEARKILLTVVAVIFAAVSLVLLIACANVANLLLARATARQKEIAVRLSVGASRGRLIRQLLTESVLLALPAGLLGALVAALCVGPVIELVISRLPVEFPALAFDSHPDLRVLGFTMLLTVLTGIVFGLAPALQASRPDLVTALKEESAGSGTHGSRSFLRSALVVAQVSVCLVLLITAGLLGRGLIAAQTIEPGFQLKNISVARFDLESQGYDNARAAVFHAQLMTRVSSLPNVDVAARATVTPLSMNVWGTAIKLPGRSDDIFINFNAITPQYFSLYGIPLVRGRNFTEVEERLNSKVAIVMESTARKLWPGQDPLGKQFDLQNGPKSFEQFEVVGVARDSRTSSLSSVDPYFFYFPLAKDHQLASSLIVHSNGGFAATEKEITAAVRAIDPAIMVHIKSMEKNAEMYRMPGRLATALSAILGAFALFLASIGIYGVVSYAVSRRIREIGIRMTLGADRRAVMSLVLRGAMRPVLIGILLGIAASAGASSVLTSVLYGISPIDPVAFGGVSLFLAAVALLASYLPARKATRVDPMVALRYE